MLAAPAFGSLASHFRDGGDAVAAAAPEAAAEVKQDEQVEHDGITPAVTVAPRQARARSSRYFDGAADAAA